MKKILAVCLCLVMVTGVFAAAPFSVSASDMPPWKDAYLNFISRNGEFEKSRFWLLDFDNNGIPELVHDTGYHMGGGSVSTYSSRSGIITVGKSYGGFMRNGSLMYYQGGAQGTTTDVVLRIGSDSIETVFEGIVIVRDYYGDWNDPSNYNYKYRTDNYSIYAYLDQGRYNAKLNSFFNFAGAKTYSSSNAMTYSQARNAVINYANKTAAPTLTVSNKSNGIRAEWNKVSGAVKYIVYYKKTGASSWSSLTTSNNYYPFLSFTPGTNYSIQVQSVGANNAKGNYSSVKKLTYIPQVKPNVSLSNKSNGVRAEWGKVTGATQYIVYYKVAGTNWSSTTTKNNYFPYLNTKSGILYCVQVQPVFNGTKGLYSKVKSMTFLSQPYVSAQKLMGSVRLSWDSVMGANGYQIAKKKTGDSSYSYILTYNPSYYDTYVYGGEYQYQVRALYATQNNGTAYGYWSTTRRINT